MKYIAKIPFMDDMGSIDAMIVSDSCLETKEENLLWYINRMRDHDGLERLEELPYGVRFKKIRG